MIFRLPRKLRTTPRRITPLPAGISLGLLLGLAVSAAAVDPLPVAQPASTNWRKMPGLPPVPAPPPPLPPVSAPPKPYYGVPNPTSPSGGVPGRTVTFQKPSGSNEPVPEVPGKIDPRPLALPQKKAEPPAAEGYSKSDLLQPNALELPKGLERGNVFRFDGNDVLRKRLTTEVRNSEFPTVKPLVKEGVTYQPKYLTENYPSMQAMLEPSYVVYRRLYFEDKNSERFGWELGIMQPALSALVFYKDALLYPARLGSNLFERYETSAGQNLPGSPVPYFLYPPQIDLFGATVGAGAILGTVAMGL